MSTYTIPVTGPDPRLAMLRALALKARARLSELWNGLTLTFGRVRQLTRAVATTGLALIGSEQGYHLVRRSLGTAFTGVARLAWAGLRLLATGAGLLGRLVHTGVAALSPTAASTVSRTWDRYVARPLTTTGQAISGWLRDSASIVAALSGTALVRSVTVRAAQVASVAIGVHTLSQGAIAAKIVQLLPWAMDAVLAITNPARAAVLVGAAFLAAMATAVLRLMNRPGPRHSQPPIQNDLREAGAPDLHTTRRPTNDVSLDHGRIAAALNIEITPDGAVLVHGIPAEVPREIGEQLATIAADAATVRLEQILLRRPTPNRDDKRLLTKAAREAVRRAATAAA